PRSSGWQTGQFGLRVEVALLLRVSVSMPAVGVNLLGADQYLIADVQQVEATMRQKVEAGFFAQLTLETAPRMAIHRTCGGSVIMVGTDVRLEPVVQRHRRRETSVHPSQVRLQHGHDRKLVGVDLVHAATDD